MIRIRPGNVIEGVNEIAAHNAGIIWPARQPLRWERRGVGSVRSPWDRRSMSAPQDVQAKPSPQALAQLVERIARSQDRDAFAELFGYYAPRIKGYLIRQGADSHTADELAQEALLTVWRKAAQFDAGKASAGTWIFAIARNLRIDALRKEKRPQIDPDDPALVPAEEPRPDETIDQERHGRRLREILTQLPDEQATVIRMSFFEDKPHSEIAAALGLPLGTVKSRIRLALGRFREAMGEA